MESGNQIGLPRKSGCNNIKELLAKVLAYRMQKFSFDPCVAVVFNDLVDLIAPSQKHKDLWFTLLNSKQCCSDTAQLIDMEEFSKLLIVYQGAPQYS